MFNRRITIYDLTDVLQMLFFVLTVRRNKYGVQESKFTYMWS